jgi:hypothetical protein
MSVKSGQVDGERFGPWAVVTGASSGIGRGFARQLAASGINVVLVARRLQVIEELGRQLRREFGVQYRAVRIDLTDEDFLATLGPATSDLDVGLLVAAAGDGNLEKFLGAELEEHLRIVALNATASVRLAHHFGRRMAGRGRGGIILVSAFLARRSMPYFSNGGATKAFLVTLGEALNTELRAQGIHVTVLMPGATDTPLLAKMGEAGGKPMTVDQCVAEGLAALQANRATHVAGRSNRILLAAMPRPVMIRAFGPVLRRVIESRELTASHAGAPASSAESLNP